MGAWPQAQELHERLVREGASPAAHPPIAEALCGMLAEEVRPRYEALYPQVGGAANTPAPQVVWCLSPRVRLLCAARALAREERPCYDSLYP